MYVIIVYVYILCIHRRCEPLAGSRCYNRQRLSIVVLDCRSCFFSFDRKCEPVAGHACQPAAGFSFVWFFSFYRRCEPVTGMYSNMSAGWLATAQYTTTTTRTFPSTTTLMLHGRPCLHTPCVAVYKSPLIELMPV